MFYLYSFVFEALDIMIVHLCSNFMLQIADPTLSISTLM